MLPCSRLAWCHSVWLEGLGLWVQPWHRQGVPGCVMELPLCLGHLAGPDLFLTAPEAGARAAEEPHPHPSLHFLETVVPGDGEAHVCGGLGKKEIWARSWSIPRRIHVIHDHTCSVLLISSFYPLINTYQFEGEREGRENTWGRKGPPGCQPISFPREEKECRQEYVCLQSFVLSKPLCAFGLYCWEILWGSGSKSSLCLLPHCPTPLSGSHWAASPSCAPMPAHQGLLPAPSPGHSPNSWIPCPDPVPGHLRGFVTPALPGAVPMSLPQPCHACAISSDRPQGSQQGEEPLCWHQRASRGSVMLCRQFSLCYCFKLHVSHSCFPGFRVFQIIFPRGIDSIFPNWISFIFYPGFQSLWGSLYYFSVHTAVQYILI